MAIRTASKAIGNKIKVNLKSSCGHYNKLFNIPYFIKDHVILVRVSSRVTPNPWTSKKSSDKQSIINEAKKIRDSAKSPESIILAAAQTLKLNGHGDASHVLRKLAKDPGTLGKIHISQIV